MEPQQVFSAYDHDAANTEGRKARQIKFCPSCGSKMQLSLFEERQRPVCPECGFVYFLNPSPSTSVLIADGDRLLLGKRSQNSLRGGLWCLPGGFIEFEEDFLTTARREVREEVGLEVEIEGVINVVSFFLAPAFHVIVIVLLAHPLGGTPQAGDDIADVAWFGPDDPLPELAFEADAYIIQRFFEAGREGLPRLPVDPRFGHA